MVSGSLPPLNLDLSGGSTTESEYQQQGAAINTGINFSPLPQTPAQAVPTSIPPGVEIGNFSISWGWVATGALAIAAYFYFRGGK